MFSEGIAALPFLQRHGDGFDRKDDGRSSTWGGFRKELPLYKTVDLGALGGYDSYVVVRVSYIVS